MIRYKGVEHPGAHEPLIDIETWSQVQSLLDSRKIADERRRKHDHYLKGTLYCGTCGSRLQLDFPTNKQGVRYGYFVCSGRTSKRTPCTRSAVPLGVAEKLVAKCYNDITITDAQFTDIAAHVDEAFARRLAAKSDELADLTAHRKRLQSESDKLLEAHFADAIDLETLKRHQVRIRAGLADIDRRLATEHQDHDGARDQLTTALGLLVNCASLYAASDDQGKRLANQAFFTKIMIDEAEDAEARTAQPYARVSSHFARSTTGDSDVASSSTSSIVGPKGLEPLTSTV